MNSSHMRGIRNICFLFVPHLEAQGFNGVAATGFLEQGGIQFQTEIRSDRKARVGLETRTVISSSLAT